MNLQQDADYRAPARNPFRFVPRVRAVPRAADRPAIVEPPPPPPAPAPPPMTLAGIAVDGPEDTPKRTAILSTPVGVLIVGEGEAIGDAYRVERIGVDSVELTRTNDGSSLTITFKP
jgi:hypothetical protein